MSYAVYLHSLDTAVPETSYEQSYAAERMAEWTADPKLRRLIRPLYRRSGIDRRFSVVPDFGSEDPAALFHVDGEGRLVEPGTAKRNAVYAKAARTLAASAAGRVLHKGDDIGPADVTHVITASCTGFTNPGLDYFLVRDLDLAPSVERYHLGFMGCYAAFPALRMAAHVCRADPEAVVLVVCAECCSLHMRMKADRDAMLGNALFADGAAAAVVSARPPDPRRRHLEIGPFSSALEVAGEEAMAWSIGDFGFDLVLSSYVPAIVGDGIRQALDPFLTLAGREAHAIARWAIHPGGRAIVDEVGRGLGLEPHQTAASYAVLRRYGNMSSPTVLFVLRDLLEEEDLAAGAPVGALAFGPGLTIEAGLFQVAGPVPGRARKEAGAVEHGAGGAGPEAADWP